MSPGPFTFHLSPLTFLHSSIFIAAVERDPNYHPVPIWFGEQSIPAHSICPRFFHLWYTPQQRCTLGDVVRCGYCMPKLLLWPTQATSSHEPPASKPENDRFFFCACSRKCQYLNVRILTNIIFFDLAFTLPSFLLFSMEGKGSGEHFKIWLKVGMTVTIPVCVCLCVCACVCYLCLFVPWCCPVYCQRLYLCLSLYNGVYDGRSSVLSGACLWCVDVGHVESNWTSDWSSILFHRINPLRCTISFSRGWYCSIDVL